MQSHDLEQEMPASSFLIAFFVLKCALFPSGIMTFFPGKWSLVKTFSNIFRSSILAIFFPWK